MPTSNILVVVDEPAVRDVLRDTLERHDCSVTWSGSPREVPAHSIPDVAIVDLDARDPQTAGLVERLARDAPDTEVIVLVDAAHGGTDPSALLPQPHEYLRRCLDNRHEIWSRVRSALERRELRLSNRRLLEERALHLKRLSSLIDAGRAMGALGSLDELLEFFVGLVAEEIDVERATLMLLDDDRDELRIAASRGFEVPEPSLVRLPVGQGHAGKVAASGQPLLVRDAGTDPRMQRPPRPGLSGSFVCAPVTLSIPIKSGRTVLGVINATNRRSGAPFDEADLDYLSGLAGQLAVAIERARRMQQLEQALDTLRTTQERLVVSERDKAFSQLAAGVAHDFNNTLSVILGRARLACYRVEQGEFDAGQLIQDLETIVKAAEQGAETIRRIQQYTRRERENVRTAVRLDEVARDAVEIHRPKWDHENRLIDAPIEVRLELESPPAVPGNRNELIQAVGNLIFNAIEAMPRGGTVVVRTFAREGCSCLEIRDDGVGMSAAVRKRLFEPYFTTKSSGQGLGTSIVFGIVRRHGGSVEVDSREGEGSTFRIEIPVSDHAPARAPAASPRSARYEPRSILLVEDDPRVRETYRRYLTLHGHEVDTQTSGRRALARIDERGFDVVVTDWLMPGMSGTELSREVKRRRPDTPVILISGCVDTLRGAERSSVDHAMQKPCLDESLLELIEELPARQS